MTGPVTALSFYESGSGTFILAGEGPYIEVYERLSSQLLFRTRVFDSQAVHGIAVAKSPLFQTDYSTIIVWGGSKICVYTITVNSEKPYKLSLKACIPEFSAPDWVLDCSWALSHIDEAQVPRRSRQAFLITAHNALLCLELEDTLHEESRPHCSLKELSSSSRSVLYSAHVFVFSPFRLLVAAGTVFGDILLWSCNLNDLGSLDLPQTSTSQLHGVFSGHEGSVFGVCLSHQVKSPHHSCEQFFLASCSDDRTIRVWNITNCVLLDSPLSSRSHREDLPHTTGFGIDCMTGSECGTSSDSCAAVIWAHASRIWGVQFLQNDQERGGNGADLTLISWGEDATCQQWELRLADHGESSQRSLQYTHRATARFHSGKNIWSLSTSSNISQSSLIATGGADGKITVFGPAAYHEAAFPKPLRNEWRVREILALCIQKVKASRKFNANRSHSQNAEIRVPS